MSFILVTHKKSRATFNINEDEIIKVYAKGSDTVIEYSDTEKDLLKSIIVNESVADVIALSTLLFAVTVSTGTLYLNSKRVISAQELSGLAVVEYNNQGATPENIVLTVSKADFLLSMPITSKQVKKYKALISQNAPVATTQTPTIIAGQIWEDTIGTIDAADLTVLGDYELISGTLGAVNAKYRSSINDTPTFDTSSLEYDGAPYIVSTDSNGNFAPFVNTLGGNIVFTYDSVGSFIGTLVGAFPLSKTDYKPVGQRDYGRLTCMYGIDSDSFYIDQALSSDGTPVETLSYQSIEIEVNP